ncbi:UbiA family prenyltransferase [Salinisphaera sp.]|uniref:UbiA family prenyltransferase n=1 Tax=Salinisphaera sp. TaxID=1914330 RepID=UPI002D770F18|nr:UbiA family prenyltransferase [Salinisphaera sp.]HET7315019.1 UbiA family prenyltransferase [Salinisphaera sp.]
MTQGRDVALVVDLDGTLVHTDLLIESAFVLARERPHNLLRLPGWLRRGKARLKDEIAARAELDVAHLPYNRELLDFLTQEKRLGRRIVLATAANHRYAHQVAHHLELFDDVLASDAHTNLSGEDKLAAVRELLDDAPFDYAADHDDDRAIWAAARETILVGATASTDRWATSETRVARRIEREPGGARTWIKAMRLYQWSKNVLIFVPLLASHDLLDGRTLVAAVLAFIAYGALASSVYLLNDLVDLADDRRHPNKRHRPFASGTLPVAHGVAAIPILLLIAAVIAVFLPPLFGAVLATYYVVTLAYSMGLKRVALIDVLTLAILYTLRLIAGGAATGIPLSFWLLALSMSLFLSLAMAKRCAELTLVQSGQTSGGGRGYAAFDIDALKSLGTAAGYASVVVLALYINSPDITENYRHPVFIWLLCPVVLYWISRIWLKTMRGEMTDDPIVFAARDTGSRICIAVGAAIVVAAAL